MGRLTVALAACLLLASAGAHAAPPPLETYGHLPATEFVALSPSGQRIAYVTTNGGLKLVVRTVEGPALYAMDLADGKARAVDWAGEDFVILRTSQAEKIDTGEWWDYETTHATLINLKTKSAQAMFIHSDEVLPIVEDYYGARNVDGHWYGYFRAVPVTLNRDVAGDVLQSQALYRFDLDSGNFGRVAMGIGWAIGPDGAVAAHTGYDEVGNTWTLGKGVEHNTFLSVEPNADEPYLVGMGRKPDTIILRRPDLAEGGLWEQPIEGGAAASLAADSDSGVIYGADGLAIGLRQEGDRPQIHFFDPIRQKKIDAVAEAFKPNATEPASWSSNGDRVVVKSSGADDAGSYFLVDIPGQKVVPIGKTYPALGAGQIGPTRIVAYKAVDGMVLQGVLTLPPGPEAKNRPLVVLPPAELRRRDHLGFDWLAQAFAAQGYAVFQPNTRGSAGYGPAQRAAGYGQLGRKSQTDISDGVAELARQGIVDAKRSCIIGQGYGGYAALAGVTVQQGLYRCAVSIGGIADLRGLLVWDGGRYLRQALGTHKWQRRLSAAADVDNTVKGFSPIAMTALERWLGAGSEADTSVDAISPAALAGKADAPILLIQGSDDTVVPPSQSQAMAKALEGAGKPVELVTLKDEDHWLSRDATRIQALQEAVAFVLKNNPPN